MQATVPGGGRARTAGLSGQEAGGTPPSFSPSKSPSKRGSGINRRGVDHTKPQVSGPQTPPGGAQTRQLGTKKTPAAGHLTPYPGPGARHWRTFLTFPGAHLPVFGRGRLPTPAHLPGLVASGTPTRLGTAKVPDGRGAPWVAILTVAITSDPVVVCGE